MRPYAPVPDRLHLATCVAVHRAPSPAPATRRGYQYHATSTYTVADHVVSESCLAAMSGRDCITLLMDQLEANNGTLPPPSPPKSPPAAAGAGGGGGGAASTSSRVTLVGEGS